MQLYVLEKISMGNQILWRAATLYLRSLGILELFWRISLSLSSEPGEGTPRVAWGAGKKMSEKSEHLGSGLASHQPSDCVTRRQSADSLVLKIILVLVRHPSDASSCLLYGSPSGLLYSPRLAPNSCGSAAAPLKLPPPSLSVVETFSFIHLNLQGYPPR